MIARDAPSHGAPRIVIVDDEARFGRLLKAALAGDDYRVEVFEDPTLALEFCRDAPCDLLLSDIRMPGLDGVSLAKAVKEMHPHTEIILMTAYATVQNAVEALRTGVRDYLVKPFDVEELRTKVRAATATLDRLNEDGVSTKDPTGPGRTRGGAPKASTRVIGTSEPMRRILHLVAQAAPTDATILLQGESGTGKSLVARAVHEASSLSNGPFVEIHCAAVPETLLESELFGHEKGAFSGAGERKRGLLETADGGTLFLDEIGHVPLASQVKLLRFLQEREFVRVGDTKARKVNTRVVAATNLDLQQAVKEGTFREDLFFRLNVFPIHIPPLRERKEDIPELASHLLRLLGASPDAITSKAMSFLQRWEWPGNVRELQNVIERCLILAGTGPIGPEHLPDALLKANEAIEATESDGSPRLEASGGMDGDEGPQREELHLSSNEQKLIEEAIERAGGNKAAAARLLGISRRKLYSRLKLLGAYDQMVRKRR